MRISDWSSDVCSSDLGAVMTIAYDLQDEAESAAALDCANALCETMMRAGFPPYRVSPPFLPYLAQGSETYWAVVAGMKRILDPDDLLSPGRYRPPAPARKRAGAGQAVSDRFTHA